jgi:hypothetical protein
MAKKKITKKASEHKFGIGIGLTAAAVAAAGAYFLYGSEDASKNRKKVKSWMLKAKAEVLEQLEEAKEMTQDEYMTLINSVAGAYSTVKTASKADIAAFKKEMKEHWEEIEKTATKKATKAAKKVAKKATKKAPAKKAKKAAKKAAKKVTKKTTKKK